jgi:hypothetical protein
MNPYMFGSFFPGLAAKIWVKTMSTLKMVWIPYLEQQLLP